MSAEKKAFYGFHASLLEPWDGPASIAFTDGTVIGAGLDRNGLRPSRFWVTSDDLVIMASEVGVLEVDPRERHQEGAARARAHVPGRTHARAGSSTTRDQARPREPRSPTSSGSTRGSSTSTTCRRATCSRRCRASQVQQERLFGWTQEEQAHPSSRHGAHRCEAIGSMGTDTRLQCCRTGPLLLRLLPARPFAQVTQPGPSDGIREELVTSLGSDDRPPKRTSRPGPDSCRSDRAASPVLDNEQLAKLRYIDEDGGVEGYKPVTIDALYPVFGGGDALRLGIERSAGRSATRSPAAPTSSSSRTATPPRTRRRSEPPHTRPSTTTHREKTAPVSAS